MEILMNLFNWLNGLLTMHPVVVMAASFLWGILSVVLSPCHLSSIPLAIGYINGKGKKTHRHILGLSLVFALGILLSLLVLGLVTSLIGRMLGDTGRLTIVIIGVVFIVMGILMLELVRLPELPIWKLKIRPGSHLGAFVLGMLFGAALGPCTFGFMMPVLAVVFQTATTQLVYALLIILAYAVGHSLVIVFAGTFINWVQHLLNWEEHSNGLLWFRRVCAVLIMLTGVYLIVKK